MSLRNLSAGLFLTWISLSPLPAGDWPEWRGQGRHGVWLEEGIVDRFPASGLPIKWRVPVGAGFSGPAVADGRVFLTDFTSRQGNRGLERVLCLKETTGELLWSRQWEVDYAGLATTYAIGPRATPTVDAERVYVLGAQGNLLCLNVADGRILWQKNFVQDYGTMVPTWGMTGAPLVEGESLICLVGGQPDAKVVAFDKKTGKELWRALASDSEPGYSAPLALSAGGQRQVIVWHPRAVSSLDPATGRIFWEVPFRAHLGLSVATPVLSGRHLLVSSFYNGSMLLELEADKPAARVVWKGRSDSEIDTDGLHSLVSTPAVFQDFIYGVCSYGQFRGLELLSGQRLWETLDLTREKARWASGFLVRNGDRFFINNDRGELVLARLSGGGFEELDRTQLITPTSRPGNRRELGAVNWSHPAYANRHIFARNDQELLCASLEKEP